MIFNSLAFLIFFPIVTLFYFMLPHNLRNIWLLLTSCFFYMYAIPIYIVVLLLMITFDFCAAILITLVSKKWRKVLLISSIVGNVLLLFIFKYYNFFIENLQHLLQSVHLTAHLPYANWILPIGLSFHTLQSIAYVVDVYRKTVKPEKNYLIYALFVMFYPQMVAGPIERAARMLPQFRQKHELQMRNLVDGGRLILWGLFQKMVIADRLAIFVNQVYSDPGAHSSIELFIAILFLFLQVYCDFCGYSDIARGCARVMGFELTLNFNNPLAAKNLVEFWSRWHISLTSWIRTYLFIPMLRSHKLGKWIYLNVLFMFGFSGLWHGASGTFVIWGLINGVFFLIERKTDFLLNKEFKYIKIFGNILLLSLICVFFRAESMSQAAIVFKQLIYGFRASFNLSEILDRLHISLADLVIDIFLAGFIIFVQIAMDARKKDYTELVRIPDLLPAWARWTLYYGLILGILLLGVFTGTPFVYFKF